MSKYDDNSDDVRLWTNRRLIAVVRRGLMNEQPSFCQMAIEALDEIERRFVRSSSRNLPQNKERFSKFATNGRALDNGTR